MFALTPLQCFFIGIAFSVTGMGLFILFLKRAVSQHRMRSPGLSPVPGKASGAIDPIDPRLMERLESLESRVESLERRVRDEVRA